MIVVILFQNLQGKTIFKKKQNLETIKTGYECYFWKSKIFLSVPIWT